jgi:NADH:ubiquinone reductase (non-electrogenic)
MMQEDVAIIFKLADVDNSGMLSAKEFKDAIELLRGRYPQIDLYLKRQHMKDVLRIIDDNSSSENKGEVLLDIEEFKKSLVKVDSQMKALPATAQVFMQSKIFTFVFFFV